MCILMGYIGVEITTNQENEIFHFSKKNLFLHTNGMISKINTVRCNDTSLEISLQIYTAYCIQNE